MRAAEASVVHTLSQEQRCFLLPPQTLNPKPFLPFPSADTGAELWARTFQGDSPITSNEVGCNHTTGYVGITSTPVIDLASQRIYIVPYSREGGQYIYR